MPSRLSQPVQLMIIIPGLIAAALADDFPQILTHSHNQTLNVSETAVLRCHVRHLGHHHVTWLRYDAQLGTYLPLTVDEQVFYADRRYFVSSYATSDDNSYWNLEIANVKSADEGAYECKISNRHASVSIKIHLQVQIPMSIQPARLHVEPGTPVALDCTIYNVNTSSITWHFSSSNHSHTPSPPRVHHYDIHEKYHHDGNLSRSQLIIRHAQPHHTGVWTCTYKRQRRSAKLLVEKGALQHDRQQRLLANNHPPASACTTSLILFALLLGHHLTRRI